MKRYYHVVNANSSADLKENAIAPSEATQLLQDIARRSNLTMRPRALPCDWIANATAFEPQESDKLPPELVSALFVIYNRVWVRTALGRDRDQAVFLFGHEMGHLSRGHLHKKMPRLQMEKEADYEGACAVARLGGSWASLSQLIYKIRDDVDGDYPSAAHSLEIADGAFRDCGGNQKVSDSAGITVVYWYKRVDNGAVVDTLNYLGDALVVKQSGVYKGVDYSDRPTDTVTCHKGASISVVKKVALSLFDRGIVIRAINEPDAENAALTNRITVESAARTRSPLTRQQISDLSSCPAQSDPVYGKRR
ncbi:MAG: hypothetical protein EOR60_15030 [Mesorhizobium sp.]|nr:MAG: hypothetical protein EOR60_15030 [Mesorhizobium sp.]